MQGWNIIKWYFCRFFGEKWNKKEIFFFLFKKEWHNFHCYGNDDDLERTYDIMKYIIFLKNAQGPVKKINQTRPETKITQHTAQEREDENDTVSLTCVWSIKFKSDFPEKLPVALYTQLSQVCNYILSIYTYKYIHIMYALIWDDGSVKLDFFGETS